jgi:hypothetical protein
MKWLTVCTTSFAGIERIPQPLDLSDEGLLADLQDAEEAESLGLSADRGKHGKKRT